MAESYRGLTIRIGGDTTGLQKALKTSTGAIQGADMELRKLGQALKLDPGSVQAFNLQLGALGDKATSTAMKLYQMKEAAEQIRSEKVTVLDKETNQEVVKTLGEVAKETENVHLNAEMAKASFNKVRDELHGMYTTLTGYNEQVVAKVGSQFTDLGKKLGAVFDSDEVKNKTKTLEAAVTDIIGEITTKFADFENVIAKPEGFNESIEKLKEWAAQYKNIEDEASKATIKQAFAEIAQQITVATAQVVNFENELTEPEDVKNIAEKLTGELDLDKKKVTDFLNTILDFKVKYSNAMDEVQKANKIASLADLDVEIVRAEASVNNLAKAIASMKAPSKLMMEMNDLTEKANAFGKAMSESMSRASAAEKAYEIDPTNIEAAEAAMRGYANAEADATSKAAVLKEQMSRFDASEVEQYASSTMTVTDQLVKASVEHEKATLAVAQYEGAVKGATATLNLLNETASREIRILEPGTFDELNELLKGLVAEYRKFDEANVEAAQSVRAHFIARLEELRTKAEEAGDTELAEYFSNVGIAVNDLGIAYNGLADAQAHAEETGENLQLAQRRRDYEELQQQLIEVVGSADKAKVALQKMMAGDFKMDTKWIDDLKGAKSDLETLGSSVAQEFQQATLSISALGDVTDDATQRAKTLIDTFASDMGNTDALRLGIDALKDAFIASNTKAELLRDTISKYESENIDEVAIATGAVGTNAEMAAAAVTAAFKSFDDAKKRVKELETALEKALKSAAGNTGNGTNERVAQLTKALESAREEANRLGVAAEESLNRLDMAKATQELVKHREELARVDAEYEKLVNDTKAIAASLATGSNDSFSKRLFGDVNADIANVKSSFDAAVERAKVLRTAAAEVGNNTEIASQKARAFDDAVAVGKQYVQDLSNAAKNIMPDGETEEVVKLRQEFGSAKNAVTMLTSEATKLNAKVIELSQQRDMSPKGSERWNELDSEVTQIRARLEEVRQRLQGMGDDTKGAIAIAQWEEYIDKIVAANAELSKLETGKLFGTAESSSAFMQSVNNVMQHVERFGSKVVESADVIDAAFRDMRKTVDGTESQFKTLREEAIKFSQTHFTSADTMLEMEALGGQLGVTVEKLEEFGAVAANLSIATDIGAEDVALQLGQLTNIMSDLNEDTFQNVGDALVRLGNNTATTESKIMGVAERMAAIANVTSMTTPDLLAWSAAIASTGQRSESAATAINNSITGIGQAVAEGGSKLTAFAKIANMTADEFKTLWEESSSDALEAFVKGLGNLTDESTEAIAALDSVGISSVRQETALLALSQTIDNLDNSMRLAREGFNGGGDAAREAAQKADGFSGSLQILKNNVANLAATFGDGLVPYINLASGALELLYNIINSLSPVTKTVIVGITGISAALAVAVPVLQKFSEGWKKLSADMAASNAIFSIGPKIAAAMTSLSGLKSALGGVGSAIAATLSSGVAEVGAVSTAFAGLGTAIGGAATALGGLILPIAGIAALVAAVDTAINAYNDWKQEQEEFNSAMRSARGEMDAAKASVEEYATSLQSASETSEQIAENTSNFLQSQSEFIDSVSGSLEKVGKDSALIENYAQTIEELSGHVDGNKAKLKLLTDTVEKYNQLAGSSIQVIDDTTGAVSIQADALRELTEEYKRNAEAAAWADIYQDATTAYVEAQYQRQKAEMDAAETKRQLTELTKDGVVAFTEEWNKYNELNDKLDEYEKQAQKAGEVEKERKKDLDEFKKVMDSVTESTEESAATSEDYSSALSMAGESLDAFLDLTDQQKTKVNEVQAAMVKAGDSLTNYGSLSKDELVKIVEAWDGSVDDIIALIKKLDEAQDEADPAKPSAAKLEEFKRQNEAFYTEQKRIRDDYYDDEKRSRDLAYDQAKNDLDDAADNFKETLDAAYTYEKRIRDDNYDDYKDQLDKKYTYEKRLRDDNYDDYKDQLDEQYEYEKRIRDDAYDDLKDTLDDAYEYEKRLRDDAYDDLKDTLDAAYDAAKQAVDDWLDDYKDALDEEVEAFEKATEERIALMEEEYEAKKKLIDDQEEADTADIDARIKAIDDQTAAEEKAAKMEERRQKIAEATAKRDQYSAGSKEYEKYAAELRNLETKYANEDEKERRNEYKEYLKGLKDDIKKNADERRDLLKESYDNEKEDFKTSRDEQKEELQKQNDEEYEQKKRSKEAELEVIKKSNEDELQELKRKHEDELTDIKRNNEDILQDKKRQHEDELEDIKSHNEDLLEDRKRQHEDELEDIKSHHEDLLEDRKRLHEDELTVIKNSQSQQLEEYKRANSLVLEQLKHDHEQQLEELKRHHEDELTEIKNHIDDENEAYKNGGQAAVDALNNVSNAAETTTTQVTQAISSASAAIDGEFGKLSTEAQTKVQGAMDAIKAGLTSKDPEVVAATQQVVANMSDELYDMVIAAQASGMEVPAELAKAIVENANLSQESVNTLVNDTAGTFGMIPESARSSAETAMLALSTTLTSKTPETVAAANQFVSDNAEALAQLVVAAQNTGMSVPPALANAITENASVPETAAGDLANAVVNNMDFLPDSLKNLVQIAAIGMGTEMENATGPVTAAQNLASQLKGPLDELPPEATAKAKAMVEALTTELTSEDPTRRAAAENLVKQISEPLATIVGVAQQTGTDVPTELYTAMFKAALENKEKPKTLAEAIAQPFEALSDVFGTHGSNAAVGWNNKFVEKVNSTVIPNVTKLAQSLAGVFKKEHEISSPSKLFGWYADMDAEGYMSHWEAAKADLMALMSDIATGVVDKFADTDFSDAGTSESLVDDMKKMQEVVIARTSNMMDDMLETMRRREDELAAQAERMARIMEDGFDPTLTAAYEAVDTIDAGRSRRRQAEAAAQPVSSVTNAPVINITIPNVVMHEKADLNAFSEQIARKIRRELAASLR